MLLSIASGSLHYGGLITYLAETERCSGLSLNTGDVALIMDFTCGFELMFLFIVLTPALYGQEGG